MKKAYIYIFSLVRIFYTVPIIISKSFRNLNIFIPIIKAEIKIYTKA